MPLEIWNNSWLRFVSFVSSAISYRIAVEIPADEQLYDLTHTIDALDNDIDEIVAMRNKIVSLKPSVDVGQVSLQADLKGLAALTTDSGKRIVSLETWLLQLHKWSKEVKKLVKSGQAGETMKEVGEIKFQLANAKLVRSCSPYAVSRTYTKLDCGCLDRTLPLRWKGFEKELTRNNRSENVLVSGWLDTFDLVNPRSRTRTSKDC